MSFVAAPPHLLYTKTLSLLSPIPTISPSPIIRTQKLSFSLKLPNPNSHKSLLPHFASRSPTTNPEFDEFEPLDEEEEEEEEVLDAESDGDNYAIDDDALEKEAKEAVREYSSSLSRELIIDDEVIDQKESRKQKRRKTFTSNIPDHLLPRAAIVGRPNVGKSALFNRFVGGNRAIVVDEPGVTRDRLYGRSYWGEYEFMVVDTGGVLTVSKSRADVMEELAITTTVGMDGIPLATREAAVARMPSMIERQATAAVEEASVVIFLVDGQVVTV